ncbi:MAG: histidine kinase [Vicinamibacterales bacterium]
MGISRRVLALLLVVAVLASAFSTLLAVQYMHSIGREPELFELAFLNSSFWFGWMALAAPLVWLTSRLRLDRNPRLAVPVYVAALVAAAVTHVASQSTARTYLAWQRAAAGPDGLATFSWLATWRETFPLQLTQLIDWELLAGAAIVGIAHAAYYYRETQQRALREAQLETRLVATQLQMLQRQLHPHFLFNTLHAISALMHRDVSAADRMLVRLSDLLRLTLDSVTRPEVQLGEEVAFLEKYLQIEQVRLGDRLTVEFDVEPETLDAIVPALLLQPLVENAIKHGVAPHAGPGRIRVAARRDGEMLVMTVDDSGPGPGEGAFAALPTGIGVSNTRARLQHQFGARFRFEFNRRPEGFRVLVAIPFRRDPPVAAPAHVA